MRKLRREGLRLDRETLRELDNEKLSQLHGGKGVTAPVSWPACSNACPSATSVC
jgi:hypothetical protein